MKRKHIIRPICALLLGAFMGVDANGATLSVAPAPTVLAPGADNLSSKTMLGFPGTFWLINLIDWEETEEISIQVAVTGDPNIAVLHTVFMTLENSTSETWGRFEVEVNGPSTFSATSPAPPSLLTIPPATVDPFPNKLVFTDFEMSPDGPTPTASFGLEVRGDQPLVLTLRPIAVPEPTSGLLLAAGALAICRRRRN